MHQNSNDHGEASHASASTTQRPHSTSTEDFESVLWEKRHYSEVTTGCLRAIRDYPQPWGPGDDQGHLRYAQHVHKQMSHLAHLMGPNGGPIKELQDIIASNSFLLNLYDTLPFRVRSKYVRQLATYNINLTMIRGKKHFNLMLNELRIYLHTLEMLASSDLPYQPTRVTPEPFAHLSPTCLPFHWSREGVQAAQPTNALPGVNANPSSTMTSTTLSAPHAPQNLLRRWTCPLRYHEYHTIQTCSEFFAISARERRLRMKRVACFTCFGRGAPCTAQHCRRFQDVPKELLCKDCISTTKADCPIPNYLLCGLAHHEKPTKEALVATFESWIPQLNLSAENNRLCLSVTLGATPRPATQQARMAQ
jgi:hypothetical protein